MALTHVTALRNAIADLVDTYINAGSGAGKLQLTTSADTNFSTLLAEITLSDPAFGAASAGVITLSGLPVSDASANNSGTAGLFRFVDSDNTEVLRGTVTLSGGGGDMILDTLSVTAGQSFTVSACTWTAPA